MLGLHNIFLIAPPPSQHNNSHPHISNQDYNNQLIDHSGALWSLKRTAHESGVRKDGVLNVEDDNSCVKVCRDCGNRAKKECVYSRCRTCCKSRGYDCATHVKSTWVPAARRRERKVALLGDGGSDHAGAAVSGSSGSSSCGGKRPRLLVSARNITSNSTYDTASKSLNLEAASCHHQDSSFKESLPGQVRAPAVFRCIRVTAISDGEAEVAYQATVNISGHLFKGFLYDQGVDEKNVFPCISKMHLESSSRGRNRDGDRDRDSSSPIVDPPNAFAASGD